MWIIKNRVTGEYERKGQSCKRDRFNRHAWDTLGRAKCHVAYIGFDEWFMDADFIEVTEEGTGRTEPVVDYLREYYGATRPSHYKEIKVKLGLLPEPPKEAIT